MNQVSNNTFQCTAVSPSTLKSLGVLQGGSQTTAPVTTAPVIESTAPYANNPVDAKRLNEEERSRLSAWFVDECQQAGTKVRETEAHGDTLRRQTIALLSLKVALFPETDWNRLLVAQEILPEKIQSKHKMAKAVAATFGLNPKAENEEHARQAGKMIDRFALAVEWLASQILAMDQTQLRSVTFDDNGIKQLVAVLKSVGGITKASDTQRAINNAKGKVVIDRYAGAGKRADKGKSALRKQVGLSEDAEIPLAVSVNIGGGTVPFLLSERLMALISDELFQAACPIDPTVNLLGELALVGSAVANDAENGSAGREGEMAVGSRQYILRADRSFLISTVAPKEPSGPVIVSRPNALDEIALPESLCRLDDSGRLFTEANLADAERRRYFEASIDAASELPTVATIALNTSVSGVEGSKSYRVDLTSVAKGLTNYPLEFELGNFVPSFEFAVTRTELQGWQQELPSRLGSKSTSSLLTDGQSVQFNVGNGVLLITQVSRAAKDEVEFHAAHLLSVFRMLASLPLTDTDLTFKVDSAAGMHISFATETAAYELYMPAVNKLGWKPFTRDLRPLSVA
jgi:hypothetical protein